MFDGAGIFFDFRLRLNGVRDGAVGRAAAVPDGDAGRAAAVQRPRERELLLPAAEPRLPEGAAE